MSILSLAAVLAYLAVFVVCVAAARSSLSSHGARPLVTGWRTCSLAFAALGLLRLLAVEERARDAVRAAIRSSGGYAERAQLQMPLVLMTCAGAVVLLFVHKVWCRRHPLAGDRLLAIALLATAGFLPLYAVRLISWHATDQLLYGGGIHLNWVIDLGLTSIVAGAALLSIFRSSRTAVRCSRRAPGQERGSAAR